MIKQRRSGILGQIVDRKARQVVWRHARLALVHVVLDYGVHVDRDLHPVLQDVSNRLHVHVLNRRGGLVLPKDSLASSFVSDHVLQIEGHGEVGFADRLLAARRAPAVLDDAAAGGVVAQDRDRHVDLHELRVEADVVLGTKALRVHVLQLVLELRQAPCSSHAADGRIFDHLDAALAAHDSHPESALLGRLVHDVLGAVIAKPGAKLGGRGHEWVDGLAREGLRHPVCLRRWVGGGCQFQ
eukprot:scaffold104840_cov89-Phaeocystis_antarctica.AAC.1